MTFLTAKAYLGSSYITTIIQSYASINDRVVGDIITIKNKRRLYCGEIIKDMGEEGSLLIATES
jgi:hypothetical protein